MNIIIGLIVSLFLYILIRNFFLDNLKTETKFKCYKLRDKLRREAINGNIDATSSAFRFMDINLSTTIGEVEFLNIFYVLSMVRADRKTKVTQKEKDEIVKLIESNSIISEINSEYQKVIIFYLIRRHYILGFIAAFLLKTGSDSGHE